MTWWVAYLTWWVEVAPLHLRESPFRAPLVVQTEALTMTFAGISRQIGEQMLPAIVRFSAAIEAMTPRIREALARVEAEP